MMKSGRESNRAYGVDLDGDRLQVVVAERGRSGVATRVVADQAVGPGGPDDPGRLSALQADLLAGTATLGAAIPTGSGFSRWLDTPFDARRKAVRILPALLDIQLPFPLEQCAYRFPHTEASPDDGHVRALAVAARVTDLEARIAPFRDLGLDPMTVEHEALALWNRHRHEQPAAGPGTRVLAMLGGARSALVLGSGDHFIAAFAVPAATGDLKREAASPGGEQAEATAVFLRRARHVLRAHADAGDRPVQWTWVGRGAMNDGVRGAMQKGLADQGRIDFNVGREPGTFLARALAENALEGSAGPGNLRVGALEHPACADRRTRQVARTARAGILAGALLCAVALAGPWMLGRYDASMQSSITEQAKALTGMRAVPRGQELTVVEQKLAQRKAQAEAILRTTDPAASRIMEQVVTTAADTGVLLNGVTVRPGFFSVKGAASDEAAAGRFREVLPIGSYDMELETEPLPESDGVHFVLKGEARDD